MRAPPVAMTVAGSDNSAGAGAQADLKTFSACGVYGLTAITCVVAEVPGIVSAIQPMTPEIVRGQIRLSLQAFPVAAVKTGMLFSLEIIEAVCAELAEMTIPLVVDPVMVASSGDRLLKEEAVTAYTERLIPRAALVTPNLDEVRTLLGREVTSVDEMHAAGTELVKRFGVPFLIKGGHFRGGDALDLLVERETTTEFSAPFTDGISTHGTGCTYAAAITAHLAHGLPLREAVAEAKQFVTRAIGQHFRWEQRAGAGTDALNHYQQL